MDAITSLHNPLVRRLKGLHAKKERRETGLFLAEGDKVLERAGAKGWRPEHLLSSSGAPDATPASTAVLAALSGQNNPPGTIAAFRQRWAPPPLRPAAAYFWIALEAIRDPGNLGTIIRSADAAGAQGVILAGDCCDPWGPDCVRATMGSIFAVPLARMEIKELAALARAWPGDAVGTAMAAASDYRRAYAGPILLLMGSEGAGLSPALLETASVKVRIPMAPGLDSLNVAMAATLMAFEIRRAALT